MPFNIEFDRYCTTNHILWTNESVENSKAESGLILVDLWHDNVQYLLRSLLTSKYLQSARPGRLIGVTGQPGVVTRSCGALDFAFIEQLARSFGVNQIVSTASAAMEDYLYADSIFESLEPDGIPVSPTLLRSRLANLMLSDGFPIGRFMYDTTLRGELRPTIERTDAQLRHWTADCLSVYRWIKNLLKSNVTGPITFVTGHLDYNPWGLTGEAVRQAGGEVLWFRSEANVSLVRIAHDASGTLNAAYHRVEADWFERTILPLREELEPRVRAFIAQRSSGILHRRWTALGTSALSASAASVAASALRTAFGWTQTDVVIGIFAHAFSDQPLADEQAYADRFQWLAETLVFAARHPERRWVVKLHPRDLAYDATGSTGELMRRFGRLPHIKFIRASVATGFMEALCDCAVTLFGAPGLDFAVAGLPVIVAGRGPYAKCGFVHQAADRTHYEALLLADPVTLQLNSDQIGRAQLYAYAVQILGAASSPLLDQIITSASAGYWTLAEARLRHHTPSDDNLYEAILQMVRVDECRSVNPVLHRICRQDAVVIPEIISEALPLLTTEPLYFCVGGLGVSGLLKGFAPPEDFGVWATETTIVIGFRLQEWPDSGGIRLSLDYRSFASEPDWPWPTVSVFSQQSCLVDKVSLASIGTIEFCLPSEVLQEDGVIALSLVVSYVATPAEVGLNSDTRTLGIGLYALAMLPSEEHA